MTLQASPGRPTPDLTPAVSREASPFWPRHLVALFVRPTQFFTSELALGKTPYFLLVAWLLGISVAVERIATDVMRAGLSPDARLARLLLVYSSLVFAAPVVLILIAETTLDSNYFEAPHNAALVGLAMLVGIPWFIGTLYKGALALFPVRRGWARLWFVALPALFFLFFAVVGAVRAA